MGQARPSEAAATFIDGPKFRLWPEGPVPRPDARLDPGSRPTRRMATGLRRAEGAAGAGATAMARSRGRNRTAPDLRVGPDARRIARQGQPKVSVRRDLYGFDRHGSR